MAQRRLGPARRAAAGVPHVQRRPPPDPAVRPGRGGAGRPTPDDLAPGRPGTPLPPLWKIPLFGTGTSPADARPSRAAESPGAGVTRLRSDEHHTAPVVDPRLSADLTSSPWLPISPRKPRLTPSSSPSAPDTNPRLREVLDLAGPAPARVRPRRRADDPRVGEGDRLPDQDRAEVRRRAAGVHPAVGRPRAVDAGRDDLQPEVRRRDRVDRARPVPRGRVAGPRARRQHRPGGHRHAVRGHRPGRLGRRQPRCPAPPSTCGRPTTRASTTCSSPTCSRGPTAAACSPPTQEGEFWFRTIVPSYYPIPTDGPVGELLIATGRHAFRPAHIHFIVTAPGHRDLTTHIFVAGSEYIESDTVFAVKKSLVVDFEEVTDAAPARQVERRRCRSATPTSTSSCSRARNSSSGTGAWPRVPRPMAPLGRGQPSARATARRSSPPTRSVGHSGAIRRR